MAAAAQAQQREMSLHRREGTDPRTLCFSFLPNPTATTKVTNQNLTLTNPKKEKSAERTAVLFDPRSLLLIPWLTKTAVTGSDPTDDLVEMTARLACTMHWVSPVGGGRGDRDLGFLFGLVWPRGRGDCLVVQQGRAPVAHWCLFLMHPAPSPMLHVEQCMGGKRACCKGGQQLQRKACCCASVWVLCAQQ